MIHLIKRQQVQNYDVSFKFVLKQSKSKQTTMRKLEKHGDLRK